MTDHLPECPMLDERYPKHPLENCDYCNMLRACEQRVNDEWVRDYGGHRAFALGVQAAREAVAAAPGAYSGYPLIERVKALAAIDALRGSGNPHTPPSAEKGEQA